MFTFFQQNKIRPFVFIAILFGFLLSVFIVRQTIFIQQAEQEQMARNEKSTSSPKKAKEIVLRPTIVPLITPTPAATDESTTVPMNYTASILQTCFGPDKKYFQATQTDCDALNTYWAAHPPPAAASSSTSSSGSSSSSSSDSSTSQSCNYSSYDTVVYNDSPIAYWELDDTSATAYDCSSTKAHNGTYFNSPNQTTLPNGETATDFNGSTQYVQTVDADDLSVPNTGILTIEAWMRPDTLQFTNQEGTGYVHWLGKGETGQQEYLARMYSLTNSEDRPNRISGYVFNPSGGLGVGSYFQDSLTAGEWLHYALVINTANTSSSYPTGYTKIYKNGSVRDQDSLSTLSIVPQNGTAPLRIATRDLASYFDGAIGKVAVYNRELSSTEILEHYETMVPPTTDSIALVKHIGSFTTQSAGTSMTITVPSAVSVGNTIIVRTLTDFTAGGPTATDTRGNTYTRDRTAPSTGSLTRMAIFSAPITTALQAGDTITITTASLTNRVAIADEFTGLATSSILDQQNGSTSNSTTPGSGISLNTTNAHSLIIGAVGLNGSLDIAYSEDTASNWKTLNRVGTESGSGDKSVYSAYKIVTSTGSYTYRPTLETSTNWTEFLVSYKGL